MLDRPFDLAVMFAIAALAITAFSFGLDDIVKGGATSETDFFANVSAEVNNDRGFKGASDEAAESLREGDEGEQSEEGFLVRAGRGLLKLGQSFKTFENTATTATNELSIPEEFLTILMSVLMIVFAVLIYTWWRGR